MNIAKPIPESADTSRWAAVIGSPVAHSLSPVLHRTAWDYVGCDPRWAYRRIECDRDGVASLIQQWDPNCLGLSVTMPCKQVIAPLMDVVDPLAKAVGSINTVVPAGGLLTGLNTDVEGIVEAVRRARTGLEPIRSATILGGRATASSALAALKSMHVDDVRIVARRFSGPGSVVMAESRLGVTSTHIMWDDTERVIASLDETDVVISTMPAGVCDNIAARVRPRSEQTLLDVVYAPTITPLVQAYRDRGARIAHGLDMLVFQGLAQVRVMTSRTPRVEPVMDAVYRAAEVPRAS